MENVMHSQLFQTYHNEDNLLNATRRDSVAEQPQLLSLADIIQDGWRGRKLFFIIEEGVDQLTQTYQ